MGRMVVSLDCGRELEYTEQNPRRHETMETPSEKLNEVEGRHAWTNLQIWMSRGLLYHLCNKSNCVTHLVCGTAICVNSLTT